MSSLSKRATSLWTIVESMQLRLERLGLTYDVVDAAVTQAVAGALTDPLSSGMPARRRWRSGPTR